MQLHQRCQRRCYRCWDALGRCLKNTITPCLSTHPSVERDVRNLQVRQHMHNKRTYMFLEHRESATNLKAHNTFLLNEQFRNLLTWILQVRQHVHHKRTFMFLEQVILRHGADTLCTNIKEIHEVCARSPRVHET